MAGREDAEEKVLKESLEELQSHLKQLNHAHSLDPSNQGVTNLRTQCEQAIQLTKEKIFKLRKARLLRQVECGNYTTKDREGLSSSMNSAKRAKLGDPTTKVGMGLATAADVPPSFCSPIVKNHQQNVVEAFTLTKSGEVKTTDNWQIGSKCEALYRMLDGSAYWLKATIISRSSTQREGIPSAAAPSSSSLSSSSSSSSKLLPMMPDTTAKSQHLHGHCKEENDGNEEEEEDVRFKVVILTPLEKRSIPCNFFLNSVNGCKFGDAGCRRSHGYWKKRSEIRPINGGGGGGVEEEIVPGMRLKTSSSSVAVKECLARYKGDELWYPAMIKSVERVSSSSSSPSSSSGKVILATTADEEEQSVLLLYRVVYHGYQDSEEILPRNHISNMPEKVHYGNNNDDGDQKPRSSTILYNNEEDGEDAATATTINNKDDDDDDSSSSSSSGEEEDSDGMNKSHAFKRGLKSGLLDAKMQYFGRWQAHTSGFGMKILAKYGYKRGQPLGTSREGGREDRRLVHPVIPKFVVPGRSLDYAFDHTEFHRNKYRHHEKNMERGGSDKQFENKNKKNGGGENNCSSVFDLINAAGKIAQPRNVGMMMTEPTTSSSSYTSMAASSSSRYVGISSTDNDSSKYRRHQSRARSEKDTRRSLMEIQDKKRELERKLRQFAKSLIRNATGGVNADFRHRHEEARRELENIKRLETSLNDSLKMRKGRKSKFKF